MSSLLVKYKELMMTRLKDAAALCGFRIIKESVQYVLDRPDGIEGVYVVIHRQGEKEKPFVSYFFNTKVAGFWEPLYFTTEGEACIVNEQRHQAINAGVGAD